jgi:phenylpropionate dioxygenase-like ring-hydroxylating dioxygenase large terminal subunit
MTYLRNCWYMAAWAEDLDPGKTLARTILDIPVVLFRNADGVAQAVRDRCPHRFAPLSRGKVINGKLTCGYHGLAFDGSGACAANPHGPILGNMRIASYKVQERHRAVWIWMGDQDKADINLIPDFSFFEAVPDSAFSCGLIHTKGNYELFSDNLLDLSHADYLHATTVLGAPFSSIDAKVAEKDGAVTIEYTTLNEEPNVLMRKAPGLGDRLDQRVRMRWQAPGAMVLRIEFMTAGSPPDTPYTGFCNVHAVTPETSISTHYFFASTRNFLMNDSALNSAIGETRYSIFLAEDSPMIAAQQASIGDTPLQELKPLLFRCDNAGARARRVLERQIQKELSETANQTKQVEAL